MFLPSAINDQSNHILDGIVERRFEALDLTRLLVYLIDEVDASALPHLIDQFHVSGVEGGALAENATNRRTLIKASTAMHRHKGTAAALKQIIAAAGFGDITIIEGTPALLHNGVIRRDGNSTRGPEPGEWARYSIVMQRALTTDQAEQLRQLCSDVAPARCQLSQIIFTTVTARHNGAITRNGAYNRGTIQY